MCGICGFTPAEGADAPVLKAMCDVIAHRGPDGEGQYLEGGVALGHRRLSLIDLEGGTQPLVRDGHAIVFNGEIYNYQDLRAELEAQGWQFSTNSDTEVLLVSYLAWGADALNRLRGMFAFAIWNAETRELFCARDFFGIKPFYYTFANGRFIFASEIKSILEHPAYQRELNMEALESYLEFQFSALPETFFKGIFKLAPGHYMRVKVDGAQGGAQGGMPGGAQTDAEDGAQLGAQGDAEVDTRGGAQLGAESSAGNTFPNTHAYMHEIVRYWRPEYNFNNTRSREETVAEIARAMQESVHYHNVADVEVGSFLSSGIDSSYMAACLAKENPAIKTFTVGFAEYEGERDEISWAAELAEKLDVANFNKHIQEAEYWESLPLVQWHMDEPSADPSAVALWFVDKIASEQVKAVLSGEGADEFFGGYRIYQVPLSNAKLSAVPKPILRGASKLLRTLGVRGANYLERASETAEDWYYTNANGVAFTRNDLGRLLKHKPTGKTPQQLTAPVYAEARELGLDEVTRMQYVDLPFWLVGDILLKTDKMSMAHSLESRVPFLDKRIFELSATIPTSQKVDESNTKVTLRQAAETAIPKDWAQKEKLGFPVPVEAWLREDKYYELVKRWFESSIAEKFFNTEELVRILDEHRAGKNLSRKIWIIYMFLMWYQIYFVDCHKPEGMPSPA